MSVRELLAYELQDAVESYQREDGNIVIKVTADVEQGVPSSGPQAELIAFAQAYDFPNGVSYTAGGEVNENAELLQAFGTGYAIAFLLIVAVLVLQFNSYKQTLFIVYPIFVALIGSNIGLWITGNPYSLAFFIGFFALSGIVINDAIVLMDRINYNTDRGMPKLQAVEEASISRLQPILLTTITTIVGLMSVARQDEFFAGLAYTIMFGLFVGSVMTLFVIPAMYLMWVRE